MEDAKAHDGAEELAQEVAIALGARAGHQPDAQRDIRDGQAPVGDEKAFLVERGEQCGALAGQSAEQGMDVELGGDEIDLPPRRVELDTAPQGHHHARLEGDPLLDEPGLERAPDAAPAIDLEHRRVGVVRRVGVDQVDVPVAGAGLGDGLDLAPNPQRGVAGERRGQGSPHAGEEGGHGLGVGVLHAVELGDDRPVDGVGGVHGPTLPRGWTRPSGHLAHWVVTVSRPGGRGSGPLRRGPCRGRSGLHRAGCWLTASRGDPQDSATESRPPMAGLGPHRQG